MFKITIIALGNKMPDWVIAGTEEYTKRFNDGISLHFIEIPLITRGKSSNIDKILQKEAVLIKEAIPQGSRIIALDMGGATYSSESLANKLIQLQQITHHICLLIGGPEGLSTETLSLCDERWSLSKLTLPHPLVRILLCEVLYRSWTIIKNHPYHK